MEDVQKGEAPRAQGSPNAMPALLGGEAESQAYNTSVFHAATAARAGTQGSQPLPPLVIIGNAKVLNKSPVGVTE